MKHRIRHVTLRGRDARDPRAQLPLTKLISVLILAALPCLWLAAHANGGERAKQPGSFSDSLTLDEAIGEAASYFIGRLPSGAKVALVPFDAPSGRLSYYILEEMWNRFEDSGRFVMVDRRNLAHIDAEIKIQYETGKVDDNEMVSITRQYGAEILIHGQIIAMGGEFRLTVYATDVEKAASSQRAFIVRPDNRPLFSVSAEDEVERVVNAMAKAVNKKTTIAVGRISYAGTQTVSNLSAWLKNSIVTAAQKQRDKFQVATESESASFAVSTRGLAVEAAAPGDAVQAADTAAGGGAIQAVVTGSYSPLDSGAEVSVQLVSTSGNRMVLASERFVMPAAELQRRKLSLLPEKGDAVITKAEFDAKQKAVAPYAGKGNKWDFTVSPDALDGIYHDGGLMSMRLYSARDCYFRIIHVDVNGVAQVIYPTSERDNNFIRAGETRRIPDNTQFRMKPPFGEELILAAAYDRPFSLNRQPAAGALSVDGITRGLTVEGENSSEMIPSATAKFSYTILPR